VRRGEEERGEEEEGREGLPLPFGLEVTNLMAAFQKNTLAATIK